MATKTVKRVWTKATHQLYFRAGNRDPWIELEVRSKDGAVLGKYVAKKVKAFFSESEQTREEVQL